MKRHWNFPILAAHSQCFERHGKLTSESSHILYGQEQRHKHIITRSYCEIKYDLHLVQRKMILDNLTIFMMWFVTLYSCLVWTSINLQMYNMASHNIRVLYSLLSIFCFINYDLTNNGRSYSLITLSCNLLQFLHSFLFWNKMNVVVIHK